MGPHAHIHDGWEHDECSSDRPDALVCAILASRSMTRSRSPSSRHLKIGMGATAPSAAAPSYLRVKAQRGMRPAMKSRGWPRMSILAKSSSAKALRHNRPSENRDLTKRMQAPSRGRTGGLSFGKRSAIHGRPPLQAAHPNWRQKTTMTIPALRQEIAIRA
jgi:hypothetical protein